MTSGVISGALGGTGGNAVSHFLKEKERVAPLSHWSHSLILILEGLIVNI